MGKKGDSSDEDRRKNYVSELQDSREWKKEWKMHKRLPAANAKWPTCLIIAPSTVVHNWKREFETVSIFCILVLLSVLIYLNSGVTLKLVPTLEKTARRY
jgi:SNF2 family DNA or RNA helicase